MQWKQWSLAIAIAIIFSIFIHTGIQTFYHSPDFQEFRPKDCIDYDYREPVEKPMVTREECDEWRNKEFLSVKDVYERNVFIALIIAGLVSVVLGVVIQHPSVAAGLLYGGIFTIFTGVARYWDNLQSYGRFITAGIALAVLIWVAYKKLQ